MAISSSTLTIGSAEIGSGGGGSRWDTGAAPIRYPDPNIKILDPRFAKYTLPMAAIERIAGGCRFTEGPVWFGDGRYLLFSDIPNDRILKWEEETGAVSVFRQPSNYANGNTRERVGRLITCEMGSQRLTRTEYDGRITVLANTFDRKRLTGPNDVVVKSDGSIWFSDNGAGIRGNYLGNKAEQELPFRVYRIDQRTREITIAVDDMERPNGLAFSPDEARLYVVDTPGGDKTVHVYDVIEDGAKVANGRVFFNAMPGYADGIRVDTDGNIWCGFSGGEGEDGVAVFAPDGDLIGRILLPERCANVCFGGRKRNRLFMAASQSVYALYVEAQGVPGG
jgi:gluconolactonase